MEKKALYLGSSLIHQEPAPVGGNMVDVDGTPFYRIENYDRMPRFLMTVVSPYDHWLFISSGGNVTCGRVSPDNAIFPYHTDDRLHESAENAGAKTIFFVTKEERTYFWEPFVDTHAFCYDITRSVAKSIYGNRVRFEEINRSLGLTYTVEWTSSNRFGIVRTAELKNTGDSELGVEVLDGFANILPPGADRRSLDSLSPLMDAYKMGELVDGHLGVYHLSSIFSGNPEPVEALKAIVAYAYGLAPEGHLLSTGQLGRFVRGEGMEPEETIRGVRPAYFIHSRFSLGGCGDKSWGLVIDCDYTNVKVEKLRQLRRDESDLRSQIALDVENGTERMKRFIQQSDGIQETGDILSSCKHISNTMFNIMRGGIYVQGYLIPVKALIEHLWIWNRAIHGQYAGELEGMGSTIEESVLIDWARGTKDYMLLRLCYEFLPLTFSRRHGDPSRPWNSYVINVQDDDGNDRIYYEGNWRDIFQNWEALSLSYPEYIENIVVKFANGITADGYNALGVSSKGVSWEALEPGQETTRVGYSGDHQVIYFLKMLELSLKYNPGKLEGLLDLPVCVYPNVSFRIKSFENLIENPRRSLTFDYESEAAIKARVGLKGSDGKLHHLASGLIVEATLMEKILAILLSKLSNFVPNGGIWMNTQRPEWNDANSALVGWGLSTVTMCYLRRYVAFLEEMLNRSEVIAFEVSEELAALYGNLAEVFSAHADDLVGETEGGVRKLIWEKLGRAGGEYRQRIYDSGFTGEKKSIEKAALAHFCEAVLSALDSSIQSLERADGLFHSYNLLQLNGDRVEIKALSEMLEGQVAILASGALDATRVNRLLTALRQSKLYREDQHSYLLYPDKQLPTFTEKSKIPESSLTRSALLKVELERGATSIVERDVSGAVHFSHTISGSESLSRALENLSKDRTVSLDDKQEVLDLFKEVYRHDEYLGRSQSVFKYEGLGSIYWHMVSKLLLEIQQNYFRAVASGEDEKELKELYAHYYDVRMGLSHEKTPDVYGTFVLDAYSHTPSFCGAQQPGMTGQVKEDVISRFGELGVIVDEGMLRFSPRMLREGEWKTDGSLSFSYCGIRVTYVRSGVASVVVHFRDGSEVKFEGNQLDRNTSRRVFSRDESIEGIKVLLGDGI